MKCLDQNSSQWQDTNLWKHLFPFCRGGKNRSHVWDMRRFGHTTYYKVETERESFTSSHKNCNKTTVSCGWTWLNSDVDVQFNLHLICQTLGDTVNELVKHWCWCSYCCYYCWRWWSFRTTIMICRWVCWQWESSEKFTPIHKVKGSYLHSVWKCFCPIMWKIHFVYIIHAHTHTQS